MILKASVCFLKYANVSKHPVKVWEYSERQNEGHAMRADINVDLNIARAYLDDDGSKGNMAILKISAIIPFIKNVFLVDVLDEKDKTTTICL